MKISLQCGYFMKKYGMERGIALIGEAGFDAVDFSFNAYPYNDPLYTCDHMQFTDNFRALAQSIKASGVEVGQTHAVVPSYRRDEAIDREIFETILRNIEATALLGCEYIVVHPKIPPEYKYDAYREQTRALNFEFYSALLPHLKEYGVTCLIENMFAWDAQKGRICPTVCSYASEMVDYIEMLNDDHFAACLDIGHGNLTLDPPVNMIRTLGGRIKAVHLHDNDGISDLHLCPYLGTIDWDAVTQAFSEVGYSGTLNLEAEKTFYYNDYFAADPIGTARQMAAVAKNLAKKIKI